MAMHDSDPARSVALVAGVARGQSSPLAGPRSHNDARAVSKGLRDIGFGDVRLLVDSRTGDELGSAEVHPWNEKWFSDQLAGAADSVAPATESTILFFFSGTCASVDGTPALVLSDGGRGRSLETILPTQVAAKAGKHKGMDVLIVLDLSPVSDHDSGFSDALATQLAAALEERKCRAGVLLCDAGRPGRWRPLGRLSMLTECLVGRLRAATQGQELRSRRLFDRVYHELEDELGSSLARAGTADVSLRSLGHRPSRASHAKGRSRLMVALGAYTVVATVGVAWMYGRCQALTKARDQWRLTAISRLYSDAPQPTQDIASDHVLYDVSYLEDRHVLRGRCDRLGNLYLGIGSSEDAEPVASVSGHPAHGPGAVKNYEVALAFSRAIQALAPVLERDGRYGARQAYQLAPADIPYEDIRRDLELTNAVGILIRWGVMQPNLREHPFASGSEVKVGEYCRDWLCFFVRPEVDAGSGTDPSAPTDLARSHMEIMGTLVTRHGRKPILPRRPNGKLYPPEEKLSRQWFLQTLARAMQLREGK